MLLWDYRQIRQLMPAKKEENMDTQRDFDPEIAKIAVEVTKIRRRRLGKNEIIYR